MPQNFCTNCGKELSSDFCTNCGKQAEKVEGIGVYYCNKQRRRKKPDIFPITFMKM